MGDKIFCNKWESADVFFVRKEEGGGGYKKNFFSQQFKIIFKKTTYDRSVKYLLSPESWHFVFFGVRGWLGGAGWAHIVLSLASRRH